MQRWIRDATVSAVLVILAGCVSAPTDYPTLPPRTDKPVVKPDPSPQVQPPRPREPITTPSVKPAPPARQAAHPRYAPPPGTPAQWDNQLGVYVLNNNQQLYYRERMFYRWDSGWYSAFNAQGPWQAVELHGVPRGLQHLHR